MPIGIGEDHEELRRTVRRWLEARCPPEVPRALLDAEVETMPPFWDELAAQGWLGIHVRRGVRRPGLRHARAGGGGRGDGPGRGARAGGPHHARRRGGGGRGRRSPAQGPARPHGGRDRPHRRGPARSRGPWWAPGPATGRSTSGARWAPSSAPPWPAVSWRRWAWTAQRRCGACSTSAPGSRPRRSPVWTPPGGWDRYASSAPSWCPSASFPPCRAPRCATWRSSSPPRSARAGGGGVSRWGPPTPSSADSSGAPSASSRPSSTGSPTCWWRWSRSRRWRGTPPRPPTPATPSRPSSRRCSPEPSASTPTSNAPRAASRSWGAWASPGSTTPICSCGGP